VLHNVAYISFSTRGKHNHMYHAYSLKFTMAVIEKKLIRVSTVTVKYVTPKV
jgi:hypothetical protein